MLELYRLQECIDLYEYDYEREALILPGDNAARLSVLYDMLEEADPERRCLSDYAAAVDLLDRLSRGVGTEWFSRNVRARELYRKALDAVGEHSPGYRRWARYSQSYSSLSEEGNAQWFLDIAIQCVKDMPVQERKKTVSEAQDRASMHFGVGMYLRNQFLRRAKRHFLFFDDGAANVVNRIFGILSPEHGVMAALSESEQAEEAASIELLDRVFTFYRETEPESPWKLALPKDYETLTVWKDNPLPKRFSTHPALAEMIDAHGNPLPFPGLVAALRLSHHDRLRIARLQTRLHGLLGDVLAKPMPPEANLFPLHTLSKPGGEGTIDERRLADFWETIRRADDPWDADTPRRQNAKFEAEGYCPIFFNADRIVNWKGQCLALLLRPDSLWDYQLFGSRYSDVNDLLPMPRDEAIPRIPLAYFRPGEVDGTQLEEAIRAVEAEELVPESIVLAMGSFTIQSYADVHHCRDRFPSICCCDDDGSRSVMAAALLNDRAQRRGIPLHASARRTQIALNRADAAPEAVLKVLEGHGIDIPEALRAAPDILRDEETTCFTAYAMMTPGSLCHAIEMAIPPDRFSDVSRTLYGAGETLGGTSPEALYDDISERADRLLDALESAVQAEPGKEG